MVAKNVHKAVKGTKLSAHFNETEFACKGDGMVCTIAPALIAKLEQLREKLGPITILSGYRSPDWNKKIGGAPKSQHMEGTAADIQVRGKTPKEVAAIAEKIGFGGIGIYPTFTHVDARAGKARWNG